MTLAADLRDDDNFAGPTCMRRSPLRAFLIESQIDSRSLVLVDVGRDDPAQMALVEDHHWSKHPRRIEPITRSI